MEQIIQQQSISSNVMVVAELVSPKTYYFVTNFRLSYYVGFPIESKNFPCIYRSKNKYIVSSNIFEAFKYAPQTPTKASYIYKVKCYNKDTLQERPDSSLVVYEFVILSIHSLPNIYEELIKYSSSDQLKHDICIYPKIITYFPPSQNIFDAVLNNSKNRFEYFQYIKQASLENWVRAMMKSPLSHVLQYIQQQTEDICEHSVRLDPTSLKYVQDNLQTSKICNIAVSQEPWTICYVKNKTPELIKLATSLDAYTIQYMTAEEQTDDINLMCIQQKPDCLQFILNQTESLCRLAVSLNNRTVKYVRDEKLRNILKDSLKDSLKDPTKDTLHTFPNTTDSQEMILSCGS